ncbi:WYL domain-containing protein [Persicobacter psychrovividus]|uniref:WYL domain-containing protein n=1 Tax=Persicobacter psychrovividus TaxID=387638 RepID=A0ABN6LEQ8_9BACT|nr:hypothetical protein PEPS_39250 [Persicobacter psychrovividus]
MAVNRSALIRYKAIDKCLRDRAQKYSLEDLIEVTTQALIKAGELPEGKRVGKRTLQLDLQMLRSDELGYNAKIQVQDRKFYTYEDPDFSITKLPLTQNDFTRLSAVVDDLSEFQSFSYYQDIAGLIQRLGYKVEAHRFPEQNIFQFEESDSESSLAFLAQISHAIQHRQAIELSYRDSKIADAQQIIFHPYLLKEFRGRWFVIGVRGVAVPVQALALDGIVEVRTSAIQYVANVNHDLDRYFQNIIGVSQPVDDQKEEVLLTVDLKQAPFVLSSPIHKSQEVLSYDESGLNLRLNLILNSDLEEELIRFGEGIKVLAPVKLQNRLRRRLQKMMENLGGGVVPAPKSSAQYKQFNGYGIVSQLWTSEEIRGIANNLFSWLQDKTNTRESFCMPDILGKMGQLSNMILNSGFEQFCEQYNGGIKLGGSTLWYGKTHELPLTPQRINHCLQQQVIAGEDIYDINTDDFVWGVMPLDSLGEQTGSLELVTLSGRVNNLSVEKGSLLMLDPKTFWKLEPTDISRRRRMLIFWWERAKK